MDLRLFHPEDNPDHDYRRLDHVNSRSGPLACHLLEWTGWYNTSPALRLLGHYRLFQLYKARYEPRHRREMSAIPSYILQYRSTHGIKYFLSRCVAFLHRIVQRGDYDPNIEIQGINRMLVHQRADILHDFLLGAETDFDQALKTAILHIHSKTFLNGHPEMPAASNILVQVRNDHQHHAYHNTSVSHHINTIVKEQPPAKDTTRGKESGVFSKKQLLILFDLLARSGNIERIDLQKSAKTDSLARLLTAITGKPMDSWLAELKDYKTKDLYEYHSTGELNQLISTLTNLAETFRLAGFRTIAREADKKMRELEVRR
jgi:hypothetical protein